MKFFKFILADLQSKTPYLQKDLQNAGIDESQFNDYIQTANNADPTGDKAVYTQWILRQYLQNAIINADEYKEVLNNFTKLKNSKKIQPADLNQYKTFDDLKSKVEQTMEDLGGDTSSRSKEKRLTEEGIQLLDREGNIELYLVTTPEAAAKEFRNTGWCVKDPKWFKDYANYNPNFYYFKKDGEPFALVHGKDVKTTNNKGKQLELNDNDLLEVYHLIVKNNIADINKLYPLFNKLLNILDLENINKLTVEEKNELLKYMIGTQNAANGIKTIMLLLENGADVNTKTKYGENILNAFMDWHITPEHIKFLINKGIDINNKDNRGNTPLLNATHTSNIDNIKTLLENGANINDKNNYGEGVLRNPVGYGNYDLVKFLLENGADPTNTTGFEYKVNSDQKLKQLLQQYMNKKEASMNKEDNYFEYIENRNFKSIDELEKVLRRYPYAKIEEYGDDVLLVSYQPDLKNKYFYKIYLSSTFDGVYDSVTVDKVEKVKEDKASMKQEIKKQANLIDVKITFDNGDIIETNVNGKQTDEQIKEYYKVGKTFNLGNGEKDNLAKVVKVEIDRGMNKQAAPTMPKPTTVLPDNMTWAWSEELKQWIAINKDNTYAVADKNVAATNTYSTTTDTVNQAVNYTTAGMVEVLASLMDKKEIKRSEIDDNYFTPLMANELIALSGVNFDGTTKFHVTRAGLLFAKKASEIQVKKEIFG